MSLEALHITNSHTHCWSRDIFFLISCDFNFNALVNTNRIFRRQILGATTLQPGAQSASTLCRLFTRFSLLPKPCRRCRPQRVVYLYLLIVFLREYSHPLTRPDADILDRGQEIDYFF